MSLSTHELIGRTMRQQPGLPAASPVPVAPVGNVREMIGRMIAPQWQAAEAAAGQTAAEAPQAAAPSTASP
jgi:hypothetical protein